MANSSKSESSPAERRCRPTAPPEQQRQPHLASHTMKKTKDRNRATLPMDTPAMPPPEI
jgi:hypothetical protein